MGIPTRASLGILALTAAAVLALVLLRSTGPRGQPEEPARAEPAAGRLPEPGPAVLLPARAEAQPAPTDPGADPAARPTVPDSGPPPAQPAAHLAGAVADPGGRWVGDLAIHWRTGRTVVRSTKSDTFGAFQLVDLPCGPGELVLGDPASPIEPPRPMVLQPGVLDLGTVEVPILGELVVHVLDEDGRRAPDVDLSGVGSRGGSIAARSGGNGEARLRHLPRGMYRIFGTHPDLGRGNTVFEYAPETPGTVEVRLRRRPPPE